jgi:hypothetical protein
MIFLNSINENRVGWLNVSIANLTKMRQEIRIACVRAISGRAVDTRWPQTLATAVLV